MFVILKNKPRFLPPQLSFDRTINLTFIYPVNDRTIPSIANTSSIYSVFRLTYGASQSNVGFCLICCDKVFPPLESSCALAGRTPLSPYNPEKKKKQFE